jgi:hypothetical protein
LKQNHWWGARRIAHSISDATCRMNRCQIRNRVFMPMGLVCAKRLRLVPGLIDLTRVDEVLLVCRRTGA